MPADLRLRENKKADNSLLISGLQLDGVGLEKGSITGAYELEDDGVLRTGQVGELRAQPSDGPLPPT